MPHGVPWVEGNEEGQAPGSTHRDWRQGWDARVWVGSRDSRPSLGSEQRSWQGCAVLAAVSGSICIDVSLMQGCVGDLAKTGPLAAARGANGSRQSPSAVASTVAIDCRHRLSPSTVAIDCRRPNVRLDRRPRLSPSMSSSNIAVPRRPRISPCHVALAVAGSSRRR